MIYVQFNVDVNGSLNNLYTAKGDLIPKHDCPYVIQVPKSDVDQFIKRSHLFYLADELLTDGNVSYVIVAQHYENMVQVYVVDPHGRILETKYVKEQDEHNYVIEPVPDGMIAPQWDGNKWVSNPSDEKISMEKENEILAMAVMELAEIILNGGE